MAVVQYLGIAGTHLGGDAVVLDLGCGTGQLTLPIAARVRVVIGMDPEPDMLERAREVGRERGAANVTWILGADTDIYLARADWAMDSKTLYVQRLTRDQKRLDILAVDPATGASKVILTETSPHCVICPLLSRCPEGQERTPHV